MNITRILLVCMAAMNIGGCAELGKAIDSVGMADRPENEKPTQIAQASDPAVATAIKEAMPNIMAVLKIHSCVQEARYLRNIDPYTVPGASMAVGAEWSDYPNNPVFMRRHNREKCVSISTIDNWNKPALNALNFRVVYFAYDSGETVAYGFTFKKTDDGSWKVFKYGR